MIDAYIVCDDLTMLSDFLLSYKDIIGPLSGQAAIVERKDDEGAVIAASPAIGDPSKYYACVRATSALTLPDGIELSDEETGRKLLGVWA